MYLASTVDSNTQRLQISASFCIWWCFSSGVLYTALFVFFPAPYSWCHRHSIQHTPFFIPPHGHPWYTPWWPCHQETSECDTNQSCPSWCSSHCQRLCLSFWHTLVTSLSWSKKGWMVLKTLEQSRNKILTVPLSRCVWARCRRCSNTASSMAVLVLCANCRGSCACMTYGLRRLIEHFGQ